MKLLSRWRPGAAGAAIALATLPFACKKNQAIGFQIDVPQDVAGHVEWFEVGVFDGSCSSLRPVLSGGIPAEGFVKRLAWQAGSPTPSLGDLPRAKYAIGVAARAADCSVLASGCTDVDFHQSGSVDVALADDTPPAGACTSGAVCEGGRCAPGTNGGNVGAGCSLTLLGAGPFADPLVGSGALVSPPGVAATDTGFLVAYREFDPFSGSARFTAIPIDLGGGALPGQAAPQPACFSSQESDGVGLGFLGNTGVVGLARGQCAGVGGLDLLSINGAGAVGSGTFAQRTGNVHLSAAHALAQSSAGTYLAFVETGSAQVASANGVNLDAPVPFAGRGPFVDAWVASSDKLLALLAAGQATSGGGVDDGGVEAGPVQGTGSTLYLDVVPAGTPLASLPAPLAFSGTWGSLSAQSGRVVVASDGAIPGKPVVYQAFDVGTQTAAVSDGFDTAGLGRVLYADVAFHQDHLFFAVEKPGAISLVALDHASTSPTFLRAVNLAADPRVPSLTAVRDGRVAVTATDSRVLVAWTTAMTLTANDAVGGYALFACTTP